MKNPEQMTHKKFVPGANPLVQIPRGWVAGTAGLPGDIEGLARLFAKYAGAPNSIAEKWGQQETPTLPTSEFYKEWLPLKDEGIGAAELNTLGSLAGGVGSTTLAGLAAKYAPKIALVAAEAGPVGRSAQRGIIKKPGGNWLSGQPKDSLGGLKAHKNPDEALRLYADSVANPTTTPETLDELTRRLPDWQRESAINQFIDNKLAKYVEKQMATEGDPIRALAERGISHAYQPADAMHGGWEPEQLAGLRKAAGFPADGVAKSNAAKAWELASDTVIDPRTAGDILAGSNRSPRWESAAQVDKYLAADPWLAKAKPETDVYGIGAGNMTSELGFDHLIDELRNATNPTSGLPADLLWKYSDLNKVTVPQAVERVSKINAWRAVQKAEADLARANNAAAHLHKDYPEKGMKWVELRAGKELPEGYKVEHLRNVPTLYGPNGKSLAQNWNYDTLVAQANRPALEDALKYEGDTMGNCVGGYCDKVAGGQSRVFSLRDKKGQPHVTIETQRGDGWDRVQNDNAFAEKFYKYLESKGLGDDYANGMLDDEAVNKLALEFTKNNTVDNISQIKGSGKKDSMQRIRMANTGYADNPDAHLVPYIQDFIRSGKWGDIKDLEHSGMQKWNGRYLTREDLDALSPDELDAFASRNVDKPGFAHGGSVYSPARIDEIVTQHRNSEYDPARVDALVAQLKEEMYG